MFIVLKKSTVKRTFVLAILLIFTGISLINPFKANAESNLFYLYPLPNGNTISMSSLYWSEANPTWGAYTLPQWGEIVRNKRFVIAVPDNLQIINAELFANNIGLNILARIKRKINDYNGKKNVITNPDSISQPNQNQNKDVLVYKRKVSNGQIEEEISVEIGEHFKNNDNFEKYLETVRKNLTNNDLSKKVTKEIPKDQNTDTTAMFGMSLLLGGLALLGKVLVFAL